MAGNVEIRFSVKDEETVRVALERLGKDGQAALQKLDAASRQPSAGLKGLSAFMDELKGRATGFAFSLGPVGTGLVALGPVGLVVAASLGVVAKAFSAAAEVANEFAERARQTKEAAETAGVTITQFVALREAGQKVGLQSDQTSKFVDRLTLSIEELRRGTGPLFDALLRIDAGLVREVATTKTTAEAIDVLIRAYQRLDDQGQKNRLAVAIGGRGAAGAGQLFDALAEQGGLASVQTNKALEDTISKTARLKVEIEEIERRTSNLWGESLSERTLQNTKEMRLQWEAISKAVLETSRGASSGPSWMQGRYASSIANVTGIPQLSFDVARGLGETDPLGVGSGPVASPTRASAAATSASAAVKLALMQKWTSVLGEAITPAEQLKLKTLELNAAQEAGGVSDTVRARALGAYALSLDRAAVAARTQIGLGTEQELLMQRLKDLDELQAKGFIKNAEERAGAERLVRREVKETAEALAVRNSATPALTKLSIDAGKLQQNLDEGLAGALRGVTTDLMDMAKGTKTVGDGLTSMVSRMADAVAQALLMKSVVGPLANALSGGLGSLFGGGSSGGAGVDATGSLFASANGNIFSRGSVVPFARGGIVSRPTLFPMANGGMGLMGEAGDEAIMPLRRLGNGRLGVESSGRGSQVLVQVINNHPNAKVETREEDDGRGGRKMVAVIEEIVAQGLTRQSSPALKALRSTGALVRA
jgi:phage-related minor tail protein